MDCKHCDRCKDENEEKQNSLEIILYVISLILLIVSFIPAVNSVKIVLILFSIILSGYELIFTGVKNIFKFNFEEDTLMVIAVIAAFCIGEFEESALVLILYRLGEFLEERAEHKSEESINEIVKIKAEKANLIKENNDIDVVNVETIKVDDTILIKPGEKIPVDCIVIGGDSQIDTSSLTGESKPVYVNKGSELLSGEINLTGALTCRTIRDVEHSAASQIIDLVYEATNNKGKTEKFITKFSKIYTPIVIVFSIILAIIPPILGYLDFKTWLIRALIFLVASCPCSLVISIPLAFFSAVGKISKKGMIIKGTKHIENLSKATVVAFDKTGTLTTGSMTIEKIEAYKEFDRETIIKYIYSIESLSNHPISTAILNYVSDIQKLEVKEYKEIPGYGLYGKIEENEVLFGNRKLLNKYNIDTSIHLEENAIYLAISGEIVGYIILKESVREECKGITLKLKKLGIRRTIILTGDNEISAKKVADELGIIEIKSGLLPQDKLKEIEDLKTQNEKVIYIGDGINDSPVLSASNFGIAMGGGSNIASITADSILISNNLEALPEIIKTARRTMKVVRFNIAFSLIIKAIVLLLGVLGIAPIWLAVFADTGVTFLTIFNAVKNIK